MLAVAMADTPRGAEEASAAAIAGLRPLVRAVVARVLGGTASEADVEDGAHEALRRALEGRERLRPGEPVGPWVTGIARHVALDQRRARQRRREEAGEAGNTHLESAADPGPSPETTIDVRRRSVQLQAALEGLPEGARAALVAFHLEGLGYQAIAAKLGVPLGTVATWVSRGRKQVMTAMGPNEPGGSS
jgi:RNA polymerase sigma factor (sigma-70 family)